MDPSFWDGKEVVVLGGAGFIGSNVALRLAEAQARVCVVDGLIPGCGGSLANLAGGSRTIEFVHANLARDEVPDVIARAAVIVDAMGDTAHGRSVADPRRDIEHNLVSQVAMLEAVRRSGKLPRVVLVSTRQLYGAPLKLPVDEGQPVGPPDPNAINKLAAEHYAVLYERLYGFSVVRLRLTNVFGPRQANADPSQGVTGYVIGRLLRGEPVTLFGGGRFRRDWLYVEDAVDAILRAASVGPRGGLYNIGHDQPIALREFVETAATMVRDAIITEAPFPTDQIAIDIGDYSTDATKARRELGWWPRTSLAEGLRQTIEFYRSPGGGLSWPP